MKEFIFIGRSNVGKSTLFNAITGAHAHTGNWNGVTVNAYTVQKRLCGREYLFTDLPGVSANLQPTMEEKITAEYVRRNREGILIFVIDVRTLWLSLPLAKRYLQGRKGVIVLTMMRDFLKKGGKMDCKSLSVHTGVPVYSVDAYNAKSVKDFLSVITAEIQPAPSDPTKKIIYTECKPKLSGLEKIAYHRFWYLPVFLFFLSVVFLLIFAKGLLGDWLKGVVEGLFCEVLPALATKYIHSEWVRALVCDGFLRSVGGVLSFLPQIALLYAALLWMEESGYMTSVAFMADGFLQKIGLNGRTLFCALLGFGCTTQAILSTHGLEDRTAQRQVIPRLSYISCSAKLPVYLTLISSFFPNPFFAVSGIYVAGVVLSLFLFWLNRDKGAKPSVVELPSIQNPNVFFLLKALLFRIKQFIIKVGTVVSGFSLLVWFLSSFNFSLSYCAIEDSMLCAVCGWLRFVLYPIGVRDWQTAFSLFSGLIAKENVAGLLHLFYPNGLPYSAHTALALSVFVLLCSPCLSAISATAKEVGVGFAVKTAIWQTVSALLVGYLVYFIAEIPYMGWILLVSVLLIIPLKRYCFERIYRKRKQHAEKLHG